VDSDPPFEGEDFFSADMAFFRADPLLFTALEARSSELGMVPLEIS
jgi:hypothetical protein